MVPLTWWNWKIIIGIVHLLHDNERWIIEHDTCDETAFPSFESVIEYVQRL